eukprot:m.40076 g.40076  ORF g.40076 m.40076 type:complete len:405 (+) comp9622_c0_seq1:162-1376(+)
MDFIALLQNVTSTYWFQSRIELVAKSTTLLPDRDTRPWADRMLLPYFGDPVYIDINAPTPVTLELVEQNQNLYHGYKDFWIFIPITIVLLLLRLFTERVIGRPLGTRLGLSQRRHPKPKPNAIIEKAFKEGMRRCPKGKQLEELAAKAKLDVREVERWYRRKRLVNAPTPLVKFSESFWRFLAYLCFSIYGTNTLWDKPWFSNPSESWTKFPLQIVDDECVYYYWFALSFYMSLMITVFMDVKRKDFVEMFVHHIATLSLLILSYVTNYIRIGTLILLVHDVSDVFLEGAKLVNYVKGSHIICDILFAIFACVFFLTRLVAFPFFILRPVLVDPHAFTYKGVWLAYAVFRIALLTLQLLHVMWFRIIARMIYKAITEGTVEKDARSEEEDNFSTDGEQERKKTK